VAAMRQHLQEHAAGREVGALPADFLATHRLCSCRVCGLLIGTRHGGVCPSCWPTARVSAVVSPSTASPPITPQLKEVFARRVATLKHVPKPARAIWAQCVARAVSFATATNTVGAWTELFMLPKCVLTSPPRQGAKHKRQAAQFTVSRCERWLQGDRQDLWASTPILQPRRSATGPQALREAQFRRVEELVRDGQISKACSALLAVPPLEPSPEVEKQLRAKHPCAISKPDLSDLGPAGPAASLSGEEVRKGISSFPKGSAPGPSGLRAQHLLDAVRLPTGMWLWPS
jgi:hypothetical protein